MYHPRHLRNSCGSYLDTKVDCHDLREGAEEIPKTLQATEVKDSKTGIIVPSLDQWRNAILKSALDEASHQPIEELTREKLTVDYLLDAHYLHVQELPYARVNVPAI